MVSPHVALYSTIILTAYVLQFTMMLADLLCPICELHGCERKLNHAS